MSPSAPAPPGALGDTRLAAAYGGSGEDRAATRERYRAKLARFYERFAPEKLDKVDIILDSYAGIEGKIFSDLAQKYPEAAQLIDELQRADGDAQATGSGGAPLPLGKATRRPAPAVPSKARGSVVGAAPPRPPRD